MIIRVTRVEWTWLGYVKSKDNNQINLRNTDLKSGSDIFLKLVVYIFKLTLLMFLYSLDSPTILRHLSY